MVTIKTAEEIELMRQGGQKLAEILAMVIEKVEPGVSTYELNSYAERLIEQFGGAPSFKGYAGFPAALCTSVNEAVVHGVPSKKMILRSGDIIGLDIGMRWPVTGGSKLKGPARNGLYLDMARTVGVGEISPEAEELIKVTRDSFYQAVKAIRPGSTIGDIGYAVQSYVEQFGYSVVRSMSGHGVGYAVHEDPQIPNYGQKGKGMALKSGMIIAVEPMVCAGDYHLLTLDDGWTAVTADNSLTAHYENTLAITEQGADILTEIRY